MSDPTRMLAGKAVVVTGSGRGIGAACAKGIARQGASVVVNDIYLEEAERTVVAITEAGGTAVASGADISQWEEAGALIAQCVDAFGKIDGLVNNAALFHVGTLADSFDPRVAKAMTEVNVLGPMFTGAHAVRAMLPRNSGSIVNVTSGAAIGMHSLGIYGATKGAVSSMIYNWAIELEGSGVRVNGYCPMGTTNLTANSSQYFSDKAGVEIGRSMSEGRTAQLQPPEDNSPVCEFLLSDAAAQVNGQILRLSRGELQLYTHPTLLFPSVECPDWTAAGIAEVFAANFADRQVPCGVTWGTDQLPLELTRVGKSWEIKETATA